MIIITSKQPGFRRCGVAHPSGPTDYPDGTFTPEQIAIMQGEPMLMVIQEEGDMDNDPQGRISAAEAIARAKEAATVADLDLLAAGESRKTVLVAIDNRRKELEA